MKITVPPLPLKSAGSSQHCEPSDAAQQPAPDAQMGGDSVAAHFGLVLDEEADSGFPTVPDVEPECD